MGAPNFGSCKTFTVETATPADTLPVLAVSAYNHHVRQWAAHVLDRTYATSQARPNEFRALADTFMHHILGL